MTEVTIISELNCKGNYDNYLEFSQNNEVIHQIILEEEDILRMILIKSKTGDKVSNMIAHASDYEIVFDINGHQLEKEEIIQIKENMNMIPEKE